MVTDNHYRWDFIGLSTDEKPTPLTSPKVVDGSTFYCSDNSKLYVYCKTQWYEKTATGGGGTSDFEDLENRPKYNGTAMTGETDIPTVPTVVQTTGESLTDVMSQKAVTDALASAGGGALAIDLTTADYNANSTSWNDTDPTHFDCVAVWKLPEGMYKKTSASVNAYMNKTKTNFGTDAVLIVGKAGNYGKPLIRFRGGSSSSDGTSYGDIRLSNDGTDGSTGYTLYKTIDDLTHQATSAPLSANQGKVLKGLIDTAGVKQLTSANYNYPENNPDRVALWLLDSGLYHVNEDNLNIATNSGGYSPKQNYMFFLVLKSNNGYTKIYDFNAGSFTADMHIYGTTNTGASAGSYYNIMTSQNMSYYPYINTGSGEPATNFGDKRGDIYIDTTTNDAYMLVYRAGNSRIWKKITE